MNIFSKLFAAKAERIKADERTTETKELRALMSRAANDPERFAADADALRRMMELADRAGLDTGDPNRDGRDPARRNVGEDVDLIAEDAALEAAAAKYPAARKAREDTGNELLDHAAHTERLVNELRAKRDKEFRAIADKLAGLFGAWWDSRAAAARRNAIRRDLAYHYGPNAATAVPLDNDLPRVPGLAVADPDDSAELRAARTEYLRCYAFINSELFKRMPSESTAGWAEAKAAAASRVQELIAAKPAPVRKPATNVRDLPSAGPSDAMRFEGPLVGVEYVEPGRNA